MTRRIPISIVGQLSRNNDEPVELLVRAVVLPATDCHAETKATVLAHVRAGYAIAACRGIGPWAAAARKTAAR